MDLSVIIVSYKSREKLSKCLMALDGFTKAFFSMEIIVVDNNSGEGFVDSLEAEFKEIIFIRSSINGGFAYGCNKGASAALGDILIFLNPDTVISEDAVLGLLKNAGDHPEYKILSCRQVMENGKECRAYGHFPDFSVKKMFHRNESTVVFFPDWISGSLMVMRKETFLEMKGFDESFWMYYEDVDFCRRTRDSGGQIAFFNDIVIRHNHGGSSRINIRTTSITKCEVQASRHLFIHKHLRGYKRFMLHLITITDNLITGLIAAFAGLILFFIPKLLVRIWIFARLVDYYSGALIRRSWKSKRSVI